MKVAMAGPYPLDPNILHGGVEASAFYVAEGLRQREDVELHVFAATKRVDADKIVQSDGVTVHYLREPKQRLVPNLITNIGRLRSAIDEWGPDIVHAQHPCGALAGITGGYPTVFTIHGVIHRERHYQRRGLGEFLNQALLNYVTRKAVSGATYVIPVSSYVAREYTPIVRGKLKVIPNAVDDVFFGVVNAEIHGRILYVGHIRPLKNLTGLVRAIRLVVDKAPDTKLIIAGGTNDECYASEVHQLVDSLGLSENVGFTGVLDQVALEEQHSKASVVCIFSSHETFSLTVSQGMAAGKPVVSTDSGGPSDLIDDGKTGFLVAVGDEPAFAARCVELFHDDNLRRRMGEEARKTARARFSKEIVAESTVAVYRKMLGASEA